MNFKTRRIRRKSSSSLPKKTKSSIVISLIVLSIVLFVGYHVYQFFANFSFLRLFSFVTTVVGAELTRDPQGHINILALGVPGEGHEGATLTDSLMLVSLSPEKKLVSLTSLPRDLYIETKEVGGTRVNEIYELAREKFGQREGLGILLENVSTFTAIPTPYYIKVDFRGFEKIVDRLGGVDLYVAEPINDPLYPKDGTFGYEPFYLPAGFQHLNGETALKYARSRQTSSDFDRGRRQRELLIALKDQAIREGVLTSPSKLQDLYYDLTQHVETNMSIRELFTLADTLLTLKEERPFMSTIHDDPSLRGGFLYPPLRELYHGAAVLLPAGDKPDDVQRFFRFTTYFPNLLNQNTPLMIMNGTGRPGLAAKVKEILNRYGFTIVRYANARLLNLTETAYYYKGENPPEILTLLQDLIPGKVVAGVPAEYDSATEVREGMVILELGNENLQTIRNLDIFRNVVPLKVGTSTETPATVPETPSVPST